AVGTPPFAALEETRLGPVMPQTNFELPISLVSLGGRGLGTSLMAYYNSNVWGAYFDPGGTEPSSRSIRFRAGRAPASLWDSQGSLSTTDTMIRTSGTRCIPICSWTRTGHDTI